MRRKVRFPVPAEDVELFRKTVGTVKPLRQNLGQNISQDVSRDRHEAPATPRRHVGRARVSRARKLASLDESLPGGVSDRIVEVGEALSHRRPGVPESVLRQLRRGKYPAEGELDLHGMTVVEAKQALRGFLASALTRHAVCVRIIHGKGLGSGSRGPVLKSTVNAVLSRTPAVLAYVSARPADGGTGATYVLLSL